MSTINVKDNLGTRLKGYENVHKMKVLRRTPTIIRLDGKAFHTWVKQLKGTDPSLDAEPYSETMHNIMHKTALYLLNNIQNAVFVYSQSDELSILLNDWKKLNTDQWFDGSIQKIASVSASMATVAFNSDSIFTPALFDARVFNVPKEEVVNYFIWRQQDATRNSINMLGQFHFSHKDLQGKNVSQVQDMLMADYGKNWNDIDTWKRRGFCVTCDYGYNSNIPIFTKTRDYIEKYMESEDE